MENLWDIMPQSIQGHQVVPQTIQELSDALVKIWEGIRETLSVVSLGWMPLRSYKCI